MIWLAWRQLRSSAYAVFGFLALCAIAFALTGPHLLHVYDTVVKPCAKRSDCNTVTQVFLQSDALLRHFIQLMIVFPALLGAFWGAPLVAREFENGTFRLAWTQSVTRRKWLAMRLAVAGVTAVGATGLFTLMVTWWSSPFDRINNSPYGTFDLRDVAPLGYAAFAFALGVALGAIIRRTLPAMITTLVAFIGVRLYFSDSIRSRFEAPLHMVTKFTLPFSSAPVGGKSVDMSAWVIAQSTENAAGKVIGRYGGIGPNGSIGFNFKSPHDVTFKGVGRCPNVFPKNLPLYGNHRSSSGPLGGHVTISGPPRAALAAMNKCVNSFHLTNVITYQPASRYWPFQWIEMSSYLALALALSAFAVWWVHRR